MSLANYARGVFGAFLGRGAVVPQRRVVINSTATASFYASPRLRVGGFSNPLKQSAWVYAAINCIATNVRQVPWLIRTGDRKDSRIVDDGPWVELFDRPNPAHTRTQFWHVTMYNLERAGECMWVKEGKTDARVGPNDVPFELWPMNGSLFEPILDAATRSRLLSWCYRPRSGQIVFYEPHELVVLKYPDPDNPWGGLAPLDAAMRSARTDFKMAEYNEAFFDNDATPGGVLMTDQRLDQATVDLIRRQWQDRHQGPSKNARIAVLEGGLKYTAAHVSQKDAQWLEGRKYSREEIAAVFRVPKTELTVYEDINYATAEVADRSFWEKTILPKLIEIQDTTYAQLFRPFEGGRLWGEFDLTGIKALQENLGQRLDSGIKLNTLGYGVDEINERLDLGMEEMGADESILEDQVLNGAQIASAVEIVSLVAQGQLPRDAGVGQLQVLFNLTPEQAELIMGSAGSGFQAVPKPEPIPFGESPGKPKPETSETDALVNLAERVRALVRKQGPRLQAWQKILKVQLVPNELKFQSRFRRYLMELRAEQLQLLKNLPARALALEQIRDPKQLLSDKGVFLFDAAPWSAKLAVGAQALYEETAAGALDLTFTELGGNWTGLDPHDPKILDLIKQRQLILSGVPGTIRERVRRQIEEGLKLNEDLGMIEERIRRSFNAFGGMRARTIARTEVGGLTNQTRHEAFKETGVHKHEWTTAGDEVVRESHVKLNGETVALGKEFGDSGLKFPGDPEGEPGEIINCRCVAVAAD